MTESQHERLARMAIAGGAAKSRIAAASRPPQLNDKEWLERAVATRGVREIAAELGRSAHMVHLAVRRLGIDMMAVQRAERIRPLIGRRFGLLVVQGEAPAQPRSGNLRVTANCDCGGSKIITIWTLEHRGPGWDHCGCQSSARWSASGKANVTHGQSGSGGRKRATPTYYSWQAMRDRCYRPTTNGYASFGGRGITVCDRWRASFAAFLEDLGERPEGMTLDRIDVNGNYEPGNVRWATPSEQMANRRQAAWLSRREWQAILEALSKDGSAEAQETYEAVRAALKMT